MSSFCRGGKYTEEDAKAVLIQILNFVSFSHLQGVVHRDLKPEVGDIIKLTFIIDCQPLDLNLLDHQVQVYWHFFYLGRVKVNASLY